MTTILNDLRYAVRRLRKSPSFTLVAVLSLALGIGANAVVFSAINSLLLHRLPIVDPERVLFLQDSDSFNLSYPDYRDLRERSSTFSGLAAYRINAAGLQVGSGSDLRADRVWFYEATGNYFQTLGIKPFLGRFFTPEDDKAPDANPIAVISYASWTSRFHADPNIVGTTVGLNKHLLTVIGVAPRGFQGTELIFAPELWVPMSLEPQIIEGSFLLEGRGAHGISVIGRLKNGITPEQAAANVNTIAQQLAHDYPKTDSNLHFDVTRPGLIGDLLERPIRAFLLGLSLLAGLVLLAACTNLGSLLAAQVADRYRELGIRIAVGARRPTILRQLLIEAGVLALAGGTVGFGLNLLLVRFIGRIQLPMDQPIQLVVSSDDRVLFFALAVSMVTALVFGVAPARQIWHTDPNAALKSTPPLTSVGRRLAFRDLLLALQVAVCCVLVTACFTSLRGLTRALRISLGFKPQNVVLAGFNPALDGHNSVESLEIQRRVAERVAHLPGVVAASYANSIPLSLESSTTSVYGANVTNFNNANSVGAKYFGIAPGYFAAAGTRMLAGRDVRWEDDAKAPKVAVVNVEFARRVIGTVDAVGRGFHIGGDRALTEVIGVVEDGKYETLTEKPQPAIFLPAAQNPDLETMLVVRGSRPDPNLEGEIRNVIRQVDPAMPIYSFGPWEEMLAVALFPARAASVALTAFGILGLMLAVTGIYGLAAYTVARRMRELGIRIALGAQQRQVLRAALGRTFVLLATGSVVGLLLGVAAGKVLAQVVYQASADDPLVLVSAAMTMMLVGLLSTAIPARRALTLDTVRLLRQD